MSRGILDEEMGGNRSVETAWIHGSWNTGITEIISTIGCPPRDLLWMSIVNNEDSIVL